MHATRDVRKILGWHEGDNPGVRANLARILCTGRLAGTGKVVDGGGHGGIIGRHTFQRPEEQTVAMLGKIIRIHLSRA